MMYKGTRHRNCLNSNAHGVASQLKVRRHKAQHSSACGAESTRLINALRGTEKAGPRGTENAKAGLQGTEKADQATTNPSHHGTRIIKARGIKPSHNTRE